jgi:hypothetical protein
LSLGAWPFRSVVGSSKSRVLAEAQKQTNARAWLSTVTVPASAVLELQCLAMALWSDNRAHCVFNSMTAELLAFERSNFTVDRELWLAHIDTRDRERVIRSWQGLQNGGRMNVYHYRFLPFNGALTIQLEETAVRLPVDGAENFAVLCRYQAIGNKLGKSAKDSTVRSAIGKLVHQIGNSLQAVRGEIDLLRLFGGLPQQSFENITHGIDSIRRSVAEIDALAESERGSGARHGKKLQVNDLAPGSSGGDV